MYNISQVYCSIRAPIQAVCILRKIRDFGTKTNASNHKLRQILVLGIGDRCRIFSALLSTRSKRSSLFSFSFFSFSASLPSWAPRSLAASSGGHNPEKEISWSFEKFSSLQKILPRMRHVPKRGLIQPRANFDTFSSSFYSVFQVWPSDCC